MNKVIDVELRCPLLNTVTVGDAVCVTGLLACRRGDRKAGGAQQLTIKARAVYSTTTTTNSNSNNGNSNYSKNNNTMKPIKRIKRARAMTQRQGDNT